MSNPTRHSILPSSRPSHFPSSTSTQQSQHSSSQQSALQARIAAKRTELAHLQQLRDLSAQMASQMSELEKRLGTLRDGAEAVSCVLQNWEGVLGVINMAGAQAAKVAQDRAARTDAENANEEDEAELPVTLVRIPVQGQGG